jgi:2-iminobutanoate/2-iminopropanoate deaminase
MDTITTKNAPAAIGPYSQAVKFNNVIYCSGQIPLRIDGTIVEGGIKEQTQQVIENLSNVLMAAGSDLSKVVKTTVYLNTMDDFAAMNEIYSKYFIGKPARATIQAARLPKDVLVEIDCIAEA